MNDRLTASQITDDQLAALYDERDRFAEFAASLWIVLDQSEAVPDGQE